MGFFRKIGKGLSFVFDVRADKWIGYDLLKSSFSKTGKMAKDVFLPEKATRKETFEEAIVRMNLTKKNLTERLQSFKNLSIFFLVLFGIVLSYACYLFHLDKLYPSFISFLLSIYCLVQSAYFNFWCFQIQNKKLGCSISEWKSHFFSKK